MKGTFVFSNLNLIVLAPMDNEKLTALRARIDALDLQLMELLRQRADIIEEVRGVKGKQAIYIRPGREASMLRALQAEPHGHLPPGLVHRLWREMISAFTLQEGSMRVAVALQQSQESGHTETGFWDLARDHFGSFMPMQVFATSSAALRAVCAKQLALAALPLPREKETDIWWRLLLSPNLDLPRVFYRFPFDGVRGNARTCDHDGVVLGAIAPEDTGADRTILVVEWKMEQDRGAILRHLAQLPLTQKTHVLGEAVGQPHCSWVELEGFITLENTALNGWLQAEKQQILRSRIIGAYPSPLSNSKQENHG